MQWLYICSWLKLNLDKWFDSPMLVPFFRINLYRHRSLDGSFVTCKLLQSFHLPTDLCKSMARQGWFANNLFTEVGHSVSISNGDYCYCIHLEKTFLNVHHCLGSTVCLFYSVMLWSEIVAPSQILIFEPTLCDTHTIECWDIWIFGFVAMMVITKRIPMWSMRFLRFWWIIYFVKVSTRLPR